MQHKVAHLPRVARMPLVGKALTDTADAVADAALAISNCHVQPGSDADKRARAVGAAHASPVSYTHLTLPTIYSV